MKHMQLVYQFTEELAPAFGFRIYIFIIALFLLAVLATICYLKMKEADKETGIQ